MAAQQNPTLPYEPSFPYDPGDGPVYGPTIGTPDDTSGPNPGSGGGGNSSQNTQWSSSGTATNRYGEAPQGEAVTREVGDKEMSAYHLDQITGSNSPLMQRVGARAAAQGESRGLMNSSITAGNAQGAMIDAAQPFALQDAGVYANTASENMGAENQMGLANLGYEAEAAAREDTQSWQTGERESEQDWRTGERIGGQNWQSGENRIQRDWQTAERVSTQDYQSWQNQLNRDWTSGENDKANNLAWAQSQLSSATQLGISRETAFANMYASIMNNPSEKFSASERQQAIRDMAATFDARWAQTNLGGSYSSGMGTNYETTTNNLPDVVPSVNPGYTAPVNPGYTEPSDYRNKKGNVRRKYR